MFVAYLRNFEFVCLAFNAVSPERLSNGITDLFVNYIPEPATQKLYDTGSARESVCHSHPSWSRTFFS